MLSPVAEAYVWVAIIVVFNIYTAHLIWPYLEEASRRWAEPAIDRAVVRVLDWWFR